MPAPKRSDMPPISSGRIKRGPDYEIPMLRARARAFARGHRAQRAPSKTSCAPHGFAGPVGKIPHGAWIVEGDRMAYRTRLGLTEAHSADRHLRIS